MTIEALSAQPRTPSKSSIRYTFREGVITGVLQREPTSGEYTFVLLKPPSHSKKFRNPKPLPQEIDQTRQAERLHNLLQQRSLPKEDDLLTGMPGSQTSKETWEKREGRMNALLEEYGVSRDVWENVRLMPPSTIREIVAAFERFRFDPFTIADSQNLIGNAQAQATDDIMSAVLVGILQQGEREGSFVFRRTRGPSGWDAFYQWDDESLFHRLMDASEYFKDKPFTLEVYKTFQSTSTREAPYGENALGKELSKGVLAKVLKKEGRFYMFAILEIGI